MSDITYTDGWFTYPHNPETGKPWTEETLEAFKQRLAEANVQPEPEPEPEPEPVIVRVDKVRFKNELLTPEELAMFNRARKVVREQLAEASAYSDPTKQIYVQAEILLDYLNDIQFIELTHDKTILGITQILPALNVLTPERAAKVLLNKTPNED